MRREIKVAFQGGGAKLISLIAAAHAIADLERNGELFVKAVSGSSAGSIAAFLLAAEADFDKLRDALRRKDRDIRRHFPPLGDREVYFRTLLFTLFGKPIYSARKFNALVSDILKHIDIDPEKSLKDYVNGKQLHIIWSDIYGSKSVEAKLDEAILNVLRASCAIPIAFASHKEPDAGQSADGGVFDNLPTEVLLANSGDRVPVFAVGFKKEQLRPAKSAVEYIYAIASSSVQHRVDQSRRLVGEDMTLDLQTELTMMDFNKIVSIGIDKEYRRIKEDSKNFFKSWLGGSKNFSDPFSQSKGLSPLFRIRKHEQSILEHVEKVVNSILCKNIYINMRVDANSLANSNQPDEVTIEKLVDIPKDGILSAIWQPMTIGDGTLVTVECFVHLNGPSGPKIDFTDFLIHDMPMSLNVGSESALQRKPATVILFGGDLRELSGKRLYIQTKELIYGLMSGLREVGVDYLALRSTYWDSDSMSLQLNVPKQFGPLDVTWSVETQLPSVREVVPGICPPDRVRANQYCMLGHSSNLKSGDKIRGVFIRA
ncbi:MAG: patatin-like phospholipase family protein [Hyphomicrobiales bacterium]|nr:patatin-like phospholipase family protein [Hyphomicrobiales bacterium]